MAEGTSAEPLVIPHDGSYGGEPAIASGEIVSVQAQSVEALNQDDYSSMARPTTTISDDTYGSASHTTSSAQTDDGQPELRAVMVVGQGYHMYSPPPETHAAAIASPTTDQNYVVATEETGAVNSDQSAVAAVMMESTANDVSAEAHVVMESSAVNDFSAQTHYVSSTAMEPTGEAYACAIAEVEEEKEEIIDYHDGGFASTTVDAQQQNPLAGMPTYAVGSYPVTPASATVLDGQASAASAASAASWNDIGSPYAAAAAPSNTVAAAAASPMISAIDDEDSELAALKRAAAYGGNGEQKPMPQPTEDLEQYYERTCEYWNALAVEAHSRSGTIDIAFCMEESMRLARECYQSVRPAPAQATATHTSEASFVEITDEYIHPADLVANSAVRAEVVGAQSFDTEPQQLQMQGDSQMDQLGVHSDANVSAASLDAAPAAAAVAAVDDQNNFQQATEVHDTLFEETAEATVIDSAPESKQAAQIMWQNPPAEEAQVLHDSMGGTDLNQEEFLDQKPPAMNRHHSEGEDVGTNVAEHVDSTDIAGANQLGNHDGVAIADQLAEVVGIEDGIHPSEITAGDAEAQVVGADFSYVAEAVGSAAPLPPAAAMSTPGTAATPDASPAPAMATPISAPSASVAAAEAIATPSAVATPSLEAISTPVGPSSTFAVEGEASSGAAVIEPSAILVETVAESRDGGNDENGHPIKPAPSLAASSLTVEDELATNRAPTCYVEDESTPNAASRLESGGENIAAEAEGVSRDEALQASATEAESSSRPGWLCESPAPSRNNISDADRQATSTSVASERSTNSQVSLSQISTQLARSTGNVMEALFGEKVIPGRKAPRANANEMDLARCIMPRTLLPWSVIHNTSNNMWIATLQTNQKALDTKNVKEASKSLRAFSLPTEAQAICLARSWTPPRMHPFGDNPQCHICKGKFAVFRRPCHCRNCGVCICKTCSVQWPSRMIPESYNIKKENTVSVCKSCDWLCNSFRAALLEGQFDKAVALHATSNVNLTSPFANVKGEEFFAVHCAVLGKNLKVLRWLVDEHCCPIKSVRVNGKAKDNSSRYTAIVTSKGRTLLGIAMENESVDIMRYLVVTKGIAISGEKDVTPGMLIRNLDKVLRLMPEASECPSDNQGAFHLPPEQSPHYRENSDFVVPPMPPPAQRFDDDISNPRSLSEEARDFGAIDLKSDNGHEEGADEQNNDEECIICYDNKIDCVATPCGHQIICLECSKNISRCPVCAQDCSFLRVFKA